MVGIVKKKDRRKDMTRTINGIDLGYQYNNFYKYQSNGCHQKNSKILKYFFYKLVSLKKSFIESEICKIYNI